MSASAPDANGSSGTTNDSSNNAAPATPGARRSSRVPPLPPPMTPLVQSVSARVLADAEKKLSTLQSQVDALKAREEQREQGVARRDGLHLARPSTAPVQLFGSYPNFDESEDYGDIVTEADRTRIKQDLDMHYRLRREHMFKQMQLGFRQKQQELLRGMPKNKKKKRKDKQKRKDKGSDSTGVRAWRDSYDDSESEESDSEEESEESEDEWKRSFTSPWDRNANFEELRKARAKVDVVVCTTDFVPGFRIVEKLGVFKVVVPRTLLAYDESPEEVENAFQMAKMVRQEVMDKAVGQARRRRANAIIDFKFKTEMAHNINDDNVVLVTATGKCCLVKRLLSEREQLIRHEMEISRKRYHRDRDVAILRQVLDRNQHQADRRAHARALSQMDERDLRAVLDELQGKRLAQQAAARQKADPHRDALEKLLGQKVRFDKDPYANNNKAGASSGRGGGEITADVIQDVLTNLLAGQAARAFEKPPAASPRTGPPDWQTRVTDDDAQSREGEMWEAYDF